MSATQAHNLALLIAGVFFILLALAIVSDMVRAWRERLR